MANVNVAPPVIIAGLTTVIDPSRVSVTTPEDELAVLSMIRSKAVPAPHPGIKAAIAVAVGVVIATAEADVQLITPLSILAAERVAVAFTATGVCFLIIFGTVILPSQVLSINSPFCNLISCV